MVMFDVVDICVVFVQFVLSEPKRGCAELRQLSLAACAPWCVMMMMILLPEKKLNIDEARIQL